jgi:uncharacterized RDD family membrane protein YckC
MLYDSLLLVAVLFIGALPALWLLGGGQLGGWHRLLFQGYLLALGYLFFGWFWVHGGQTLGMRSWRLRLIRDDARPLGWGLALVRYLMALFSWLCLGLGFLWIIIDREKRTWHDRFSGTRLVVAPKPVSSRGHGSGHPSQQVKSGGKHQQDGQ